MLSWLAGMSWYLTGSVLHRLGRATGALHAHLSWSRPLQRAAYELTIALCDATRFCMVWAVRCAAEVV